MYGKFSVEYKIIPEKVMVMPQYQQTPAEDEYKPTYVNTLPGTTDIDTNSKIYTCNPGITSDCVTNVSPFERDILEPMSSEQARSACLE